MPDATQPMADDDLGFICKACGKFYTDAEVEAWDTRWETKYGQEWLIEIINKCPLCGEVRNYKPIESKFRWQSEDNA